MFVEWLLHISPTLSGVYFYLNLRSQTKASVVECLTNFGWIFCKIIASCECDEQNTSWLRISLAPGFSIVIKSCVKNLF